MKKEILDRANELSEIIKNTDAFIYTFRQTWKHGILKSKANLSIGHVSFGAIEYSEIEADKALSDKIYNALIEYQSEIKKEFDELK